MTVAIERLVMLSRIGLSYSSISTTAVAPNLACVCRISSANWPVTSSASGPVSTGMPSASRLTRNWSRMRRSSSARLCSTLSPKSMRITGCRRVQSQRVSAASPVNSARSPSNSVLNVSSNRLLPKRRGRLRK
jgi:hypothetical protein